MKSILSLGSVALVAVVGCAAPEADGETSPGSGEAALTEMKYYDCSGGGDSQMSHVEIGINDTTLSVTDLSKDAAPPDSGRIDRDYRPTSATYRDAIRYSGYEALVRLWDEVGSVDMIVSKEIQRNAAQGKIWMRTAGGSGGATTSYWCKSKPSKLTVDTNRRSRLMCDFKLVCTHDNPPGDTCLDSAFINQTSAGGSTLRTSYYDHFGVHAQERRESIGASSSMERSASSFSGEWSGHRLSLEYRGGVTYVGTFTLPDGRSTSAQCNDLAMLD